MGVGLRLTRLAAVLLAASFAGPAAAKVSLEIFAMKPNKFAEKSFHERLSFADGLEAEDRVLAALKNLYPDNRLLPDELKKYPVIEISGAEHLLKAYTAAKGWFSPTMKIFTKVSRDRQKKPPFNVLRIGFNESSVPLFGEELERLDSTLAGIDTALDAKLQQISDKAKNVEDRLQGFSDDLKKEEQARVAGVDKAGGSALMYSGVAGVLALFAIIAALLQGQARKKHEQLLKAQLEKGGEPANYLKL